eukprot:6181833-Pleurochrysis_carterae.AAC.1
MNTLGAAQYCEQNDAKPVVQLRGKGAGDAHARAHACTFGEGVRVRVRVRVRVARGEGQEGVMEEGAGSRRSMGLKD